ncbi:hypothetical protein PIROE2DRAFT_5487 [Piromyces sp. E2]|nr:hypothetical protein PIROE2DRAFT_5487 [Piromyces sp. E2]|eukprot:OUM67108.1 hypothetical protein PIROE2DRAFT_5487 [Piromyces sp. E2]
MIIFNSLFYTDFIDNNNSAANIFKGFCIATTLTTLITGSFYSNFGKNNIRNMENSDSNTGHHLRR